MRKDERRSNGRWTKTEHEQFLLGLQIYGRNWKKIESIISTRTGSQIRSHAQKFFLKFKDNPAGLPEIRQKMPIERMEQEENQEYSQESSLERNSCQENESDSSFLFTQMYIYSDQRNKLSLKIREEFDFWTKCIEIKPQNEPHCENTSPADHKRKLSAFSPCFKIQRVPFQEATNDSSF